MPQGFLKKYFYKPNPPKIENPINRLSNLKIDDLLKLGKYIDHLF